MGPPSLANVPDKHAAEAAQHGDREVRDPADRGRARETYLQCSTQLSEQVFIGVHSIRDCENYAIDYDRANQ
jgi:hypothetical protein